MIVSFAWPSNRHRTGGVVSLYHFANGLAALGHEVHFVHGPAWPDRIESIDELAWFPFEPSIRHHIVDSMDDPSLPDGDVIFAPAAPARLGLPALFIQGAGMLPAEMEHAAFRQRAPKVCIARWLVDLGRSLGVPDEQLWHVPMGLDHELFAVRRPLDDRPYDVAILRNIHPTKGWGVGWEALAAVHERIPELRAVVFSVDPLPEPLGDWVEFRLRPDHRTLADEVYNASRVFVQPSYHEGFGFAAVEAMACGAALVTTDNGGSGDYAIHDETAVVVPPGDPAALAGAIESLLRDEPRRQRIATAGEAYVRRFDWGVGAEALAAHLERYVADPDRYRAAPADIAPEPAT